MKTTHLFRSITALLLCTLLLLLLMSGCKKEPAEELAVVSVSEVTRSVFYAPQYVALALGYFEEEGIVIELSTGEGADKVMTSLISGAIDIGFSGPEAAIYIYNEGKNDYAQVFAQVTARDGSFLVGREPDADFDWRDLEGAHILPGRKGGVPYMTFEYVLKQAGLDIENDLYLDTTVQYSAMTGAFLGGTADYVTVFEPTASSIEAEGRGYIVAAVGAATEDIPYTAYYALTSYIEENPDLIEGFVKAIYRGQCYVAEHNGAEIASVIAEFFPDSDEEILAMAIENYRSIGAYALTPVLTEDSFERLEDVMESAGELSERAPFDLIVNNQFAQAVLDAVD